MDRRNRLLWTGLLWAGIACAAMPSAAGEEPAQGAPRIDAELTQAEARGFSGVALVSQGDDILLQAGYGTTTPSGREEITPDTVFLIGSIVKVFTRMAVYQLEAQGRLSRADTLARFFPQAPADKADITVGQLLEHTAGIPDLIGPGGRVIGRYDVDRYDYTPVTRSEMLERVFQAKLLFPPGSDETYSNSGFALLGAIIEEAAGMPYEKFVHEAVFAPAGMQHTGYLIPDWTGARLAHGIRAGSDWGTPLDAGRWMADGPSWNLRANGGMLGTVGDLFRFTRALARDDLYPQQVRDSLFANLKYSKTRGSRYFAAAGSNGIFTSVFIWMVDQDRALFLIGSNAAHDVENDYLQDLLPYALPKAQEGG